MVDDDEMNKRKLMYVVLRIGKMVKNINKSCFLKDIVKNKIFYIWGKFLNLDNFMIRFV